MNAFRNKTVFISIFKQKQSNIYTIKYNNGIVETLERDMNSYLFLWCNTRCMFFFVIQITCLQTSWLCFLSKQNTHNKQWWTVHGNVSADIKLREPSRSPILSFTLCRTLSLVSHPSLRNTCTKSKTFVQLYNPQYAHYSSCKVCPIPLRRWQRVFFCFWRLSSKLWASCMRLSSFLGHSFSNPSLCL